MNSVAMVKVSPQLSHRPPHPLNSFQPLSSSKLRIHISVKIELLRWFQTKMLSVEDDEIPGGSGYKDITLTLPGLASGMIFVIR